MRGTLPTAAFWSARTSPEVTSSPKRPGLHASHGVAWPTASSPCFLFYQDTASRPRSGKLFRSVDLAGCCPPLLPSPTAASVGTGSLRPGRVSPGAPKNGYKAASGSDGKEVALCCGPTAGGFCPEGPYHAPDFPDLLEMLCKSLSQNDLQAERWSMKLALAVASLDPTMDIYSALSLYAKGQPYYGSALLLAALLPNLADIFQTRCLGF